ncbi:ligand-binding sensor domain-containing protein [Flavihumibacter profundi]|uniref:ligand-binding sensor domain-containing protein n=1 Tax=Flavihumibacter profundi TaxID=2716883 RepID=UPI001CC6C790|nr:sensor histidine kinase [Flavihumibacter profundi]MBZ5857204.1 histidine kinase [Flavihumibacter profundi]
MAQFKYYLLFFICQFTWWLASAQYPELNVHHFSTSEGLSDGVVRAIGEDRYGYIWIGTVSGLNRFDGSRVKKFQSEPGQPGTPPSSVPRYIYGDSKGILWIGFNEGFYHFDYATEKFIVVKGTENLSIVSIKEDTAKNTLYLLTNKGIAYFSPASGKLGFLIKQLTQFPPAIANSTLNGMDIKRSVLYTFSDSCLWAIDLKKNEAIQFPEKLIPEKSLADIAVGHDGTIWLSTKISSNKVFGISPDWKKSKSLPVFHNVPNETSNNFILKLFIDNQSRLWITTRSKWLYCYIPERDSVMWYQSKTGRENSISFYINSLQFQSKNNYLWAATEGAGIDYFHPDDNPFQVITPSDNSNPIRGTTWARTAAEDDSGNIWTGWLAGVVKYEPKNNRYSYWDNIPGQKKELYSSSVRSILFDKTGELWIGTAGGMNRYSPSAKKMYFLTARDSLPIDFYWSVYEDQEKNIWFGSGQSLYYRNATNQKIYSYRSHPVLAQAIDTGVRAIYQDRQKRIWFGMDGTGLTMYDPVRQRFRKWKRTVGNDSTLLGNTITAITEDQKGIIWISSFNGLVGYDPKEDRFTQFTSAKGLPSIKCSGLLADDYNRLWIGTTSGLTVLDTARKNFITFDVEDGLPSIEFSDMPATRFRNGDFLFPTMKGYLRFDPLAIKPGIDTLNVYLSAVHIFDQPFPATINSEELNTLELKANQNFFTFDLVALNFNNPQQTWFTYKLDGFDKEWITTQSGIANYTNVPGGNYIFRYKAGTSKIPGNNQGKYLTVNIDTIYYKSTWFWLLLALLAGLLLYTWYRSRLAGQRRLFDLQSKAQNLEKEKALVMFEGLKQQLNPHFLFNSLSSLSSLIRTNQSLAVSFLDNLSKIYRYILQSQDNDLTTLRKELDFAASYIQLLETRFQKGLQIRINVKPDDLELKIVPVTLQNLIDNAIKHNTVDEEYPLIIEIYSEPSYLVISNNLQKKTAVETSNKHGLLNLRSLYHYFTDLPVIIEETKTSFTIKIPLI